MSDHDDSAAPKAVPPIKRRVIRSAQTTPEDAAEDPSKELGADAASTPTPATVTAPARTEPLPALRVESRPDGQRYVDARAPRSARPERRIGASHHSLPRRPERGPRIAQEDGGGERPAPQRREDAEPRKPRDESRGRPRREPFQPGERERRGELGRRHEPAGERGGERRPREAAPVRPEAAKAAAPAAPAPIAAPAKAGSAPPEPALDHEIALAGAPPVREKAAKKEKDKPKTGKEAIALKARAPKRGKKRGGGPSGPAAPTRKQGRQEPDDARDEDEADEQQRESSPAEQDEAPPQRPSFWQRVVGLFKRKR